jgi:hypothetical protein
MAKRRTAVVVRPQFGGFRPAAPVIIRQTRTVTKKKKHHRRRGGAAESSSLTSKENVGLATGALVLGFIDRQGVKIPSIPILGRAGTIAAAGMLVGRHMHLPIATRVGKAALVIALYELGKQGKIDGIDTL